MILAKWSCLHSPRINQRWERLTRCMNDKLNRLLHFSPYPTRSADIPVTWHPSTSSTTTLAWFQLAEPTQQSSNGRQSKTIPAMPTDRPKWDENCYLIFKIERKKASQNSFSLSHNFPTFPPTSRRSQAILEVKNPNITRKAKSFVTSCFLKLKNSARDGICLDIFYPFSLPQISQKKFSSKAFTWIRDLYRAEWWRFQICNASECQSRYSASNQN